MTAGPIKLIRNGIETFTGLADPAPGGGSQPGAVRTIGPISVTPPDFSAADIFNFIAAPLYTPTAGDMVIGFSWLLRTVFTVSFTTFTAGISPQTSPNTGDAGPPLVPVPINLGAVQGQGAGQIGGDYFASSWLPLDRYTSGSPAQPSTSGPLLSDGTGLYLSAETNGPVIPEDTGQIDFYIHVCTPAAP